MIAVALGTLVLATYLDSIVISRFDRALTDRHTQLAVALSNNGGYPQRLNATIYDPTYSAPFSGRYWQITSPTGEVYVSDSLLDDQLNLPVANASLGIISLAGPRGELLRSISQVVTLEDGTEWTVSVADDQRQVQRERTQLRKSLLLAFAFIGFLGIAGAFLQTAAITAPIRKLSKDVLGRWEENEKLDVASYPEEVAPLVTDINELLDRNREIVSRARRQAADLAHALKTPSAILRNELTMIDSSVDVSSSLEALDKLDAQLGRSLARMRTANSGASTRSRSKLDHSVKRFERMFSALAEREGKTLRVETEDGLTISMDQQDIEEVMGNTLDNALKWCRSEVRLTAQRGQTGVDLIIEDDGPGIPEDNQREALRSGGRLDSSKPGTGLGLAIAVDLLQAYGANLTLGTSKELGGLSVEISIPVRLSRAA